MSALAEEIAAMIAHDGPITLERYMALCLGHPTLGYYSTRDPFGPGGDFITAPEISQMFGEVLGVWIAGAWLAAGSPSRASLVELGPGRGTLMADILRVLRVAPQFLEAVSVHLVETSPALREVQRQTLQRRTLAKAATSIHWHDSFDEIPSGPVFILANEFFDALPVRQFVKTARGWRERLVGLDSRGALAFGLSGAVEPTLAVPAKDGAVVEIGAVGQRLMAEIAGRIAKDGGAMLVVDYGYGETALGESLQAVAGHAYVDPLAAPGEADLTAHVDFAALARAAAAGGAKVQGPVTQGHLLERLGIAQRAATLQRKATPEQRVDIAAALERLTGGGDPRRNMGELFKAIAVAHPNMRDLPGFAG